MVSEDAVFEQWTDALSSFYLMLRAERGRELRGERKVRSFEKGVHPPSTEWGRVIACEQLLPGLAELRDVGGSTAAWPHSIRREAYRDAEDRFLADARAGELEFRRAGDD